MFIRRVSTGNITTGDSYYTHRLVRTERTGHRVRQVTLLNLGRHFAVAQAGWPTLCQRIEEILTGQWGLLSLKPELEKLAQRYAAQLLLRQGQSVEPGRTRRSVSAGRCFVEVDVDSLEVLRPRSGALFVDRVVVNARLGGTSARPDSIHGALRKVLRARRAHGLTRIPARLGAALVSSWIGGNLYRMAGPRVFGALADGYRMLRGRPRIWTV